jgi:hypothetical protein
MDQKSKIKNKLTKDLVLYGRCAYSENKKGEVEYIDLNMPDEELRKELINALIEYGKRKNNEQIK